MKCLDCSPWWGSIFYRLLYFPFRYYYSLLLKSLQFSHCLTSLIIISRESICSCLSRTLDIIYIIVMLGLVITDPTTKCSFGCKKLHYLEVPRNLHAEDRNIQPRLLMLYNSQLNYRSPALHWHHPGPSYKPKLT